MKLNENIRYNLIKYALSDYRLCFDYKKGDNLNYILCKNIIEKAHICIYRQYNKKDNIPNNSLNQLINYVISEIIIDDEFYINGKNQILDIIHLHNIGMTDSIENVSYGDYFDLFECCRLFIDMQQAKQNRNADNHDNDIANDSFIFEKTVNKVAEELYGKKNVRHLLSGIQDIGQALKSDTVINIGDTYRVYDAKFYGTSLVYYSHGHITYRHQHNRYEMNGYIDQLRYNKQDSNINIKGIIIHAVDTDKYNELNHRTLNIGNNKIYLELVDITTSADDIIQQIKTIMQYYDFKASEE